MSMLVRNLLDGASAHDAAAFDQIGTGSIVAQFTGGLFGSAIATTTSFAANPGTALVTLNLATAQRYPTSARTITKLRVALLANTISVNTTVTLFKNGAATAQTITILSTDAPVTKYVDLAHPITFVDGDDFDIQLAAGIDASAGTVKVSVTLES